MQNSNLRNNNSDIDMDASFTESEAEMFIEEIRCC
jgi:hypothetical protein